jgi:hypothetical protein
VAKFPFTDLHSFKDYVAFVRLCAPDEFPEREGLAPDERWTLDLAFDGLRYGLDLTAKEKGDLPVLTRCRGMVEEAYEHYRAGRMREGFFKLQEMEKNLKKLPSQ